MTPVPIVLGLIIVWGLVKLAPPQARGLPQGSGWSAARWLRRLTGLIRREDHSHDFVMWCRALAREVRAGKSLASSCRDLVTRYPWVANSWTVVDQRMRIGMPFDTAIEVWSPPVRNEYRQQFLVAVTAAHRSGAPIASTLEDLAALIDQHVQLRQELRALTSQSTASAAMLVGLPVIVVPLIASLEPGVVHVLIGTAIGRLCVGAAIGLLLLGWRWMRSLIGAVDS